MFFLKIKKKIEKLIKLDFFINLKNLDSIKTFDFFEKLKK